MLTRKRILLLLIISSIIFRIGIFYPGFFPNVDAAEFATFVREISLNSGYIPSVNSIYFPGTAYIYPPLLFYFAYLVDIPLGYLSGNSNLLQIYTLLAIAVAAGAYLNLMIYRNTASKDTPYSRLLSFVIPVFYGVDIYALTWGGYPYIVDMTLSVMLLFVLDRETWGKRDYVIAGLLAVAIPLTHDLTWFLMVAVLIVLVAFNAVKKRKANAVKGLYVLGVTVAVGLFWWLPRLSFLLGVLNLSQNAGSGPFSPIGSGGEAVVLAVPYAIPILALVVLELIASIKRKKFEKVDSFTLALATSGIGFLFIFHDPVVFARIVLYSYTFLMVIVLKNIHLLKELKGNSGRDMGRRKAAMAVLAVLVIFGVPSQFFIGHYSSTFYSSSGFAYEQDLISWAPSHIGNGTVAAPEIGNYLSAIDGLPVILYSGFLVGQTQIAQRNAVLDLLFHPGNTTTMQQVSHYNIRYLVIANVYLNTTVDGHYITLNSTPFHLMERFSHYSVYYISYE